MMKYLLVVFSLIALVNADQWAVIVAGSNGYYNYRHQVQYILYQINIILYNIVIIIISIPLDFFFILRRNNYNILHIIYQN